MIQIVFDMDGVIFDTEALCQKAWRTVGEERGISIAEIDELLKLCIGSNQQHMTEVLRGKLGEAFPVQCFLSEAAEQIQLLANEHLPLKKGAEELLKWLKEQKAAVGLASSTASPIVKKVSGEGRTYGIFSDHHRRGSGHTQQAGWRNLSEGVCCAWNRSVTDVWRGGFL